MKVVLGPIEHPDEVWVWYSCGAHSRLPDDRIFWMKYGPHFWNDCGCWVDKELLISHDPLKGSARIP